MRCEIIKNECLVPENNCSNCEIARKAVKKETEDYLRRNCVAIPSFKTVKGTSKIDGSGTIYTVWFQTPIAEVANGHLKVEKHDL